MAIATTTVAVPSLNIVVKAFTHVILNRLKYWTGYPRLLRVEVRLQSWKINCWFVLCPAPASGEESWAEFLLPRSFFWWSCPLTKRERHHQVRWLIIRNLWSEASVCFQPFTSASSSLCSCRTPSILQGMHGVYHYKKTDGTLFSITHLQDQSSIRDDQGDALRRLCWPRVSLKGGTSDTHQ